MSRSILVPLDGSAFSAQIIPYAVSAARALNADIDFVQVHVTAYPPAWLQDVGPRDLVWETETRVQELEHLADLATKVSRHSGIRTRSTLLEGKVVQAILQHARDQGSYLIALSTHGMGGVSRAWLGSIADRLVHRSRVPLLLFHPRQDPEWQPDSEPFDHILVPLDGSPLAESVLPFAFELGGTGASYTLVRVDASPDFIALAPPMLAVLQDPAGRTYDERAQDYLDELASDLRSQSYDANVVVKTHPHTAVAILEHAYECGADLIAMSTHGRHGLTRIALGSVADKVLRGFQKPVLIYRPPTGVPRRVLTASAATMV